MRALSLAALTVLELSPVQMVHCAAAAGYSHVGLRLLPATTDEPVWDMLGDSAMVREVAAALDDTGVRVLDVEILRLRPDINAVIHLHNDEMIAFMACGFEEIRSFSLTYGYLMQKPAHYLPASINVEEDVGPIKDFIADTNCIIMKRHGFTVLGRTVSEAYHRTCVLVSEIKRNIIVEQLCAATGRKAEYVSEEEMSYMAKHGDAVMNPKLVKTGT